MVEPINSDMSTSDLDKKLEMNAAQSFSADLNDIKKTHADNQTMLSESTGDSTLSSLGRK